MAYSYLDIDDLTDFVETLESEKAEQSKAVWGNLDDKIECLHNYDIAINSLRVIANIQFDADI